jgi:lipoprotein-anchoring transpeptidase ErfK/SrfK
VAPATAFPYPDYAPYGASAPVPPTAVVKRRNPDVAPGVSPAAAVTKRRNTEVAAVQPGRHAVGTKVAKPEGPKAPLGPLTIAVSIGSQRVTVYDNGSPIASAPISSGMPGRPTPMGVFSVIQKDRLHHSNLYSNAPMPFMQRITWSGVALHAGVLPGYPASHGCIRLPESFAVRLWGMTRLGARVVVTRNEVAPYEMNHPRLVALVKPSEPVPQAQSDVPRPVAAGDKPEKPAPGSEAGTVVVAASASVTATDATSAGPERLHETSEHGIAFAPAAPAPAAVTAPDKPADLRPALDTSIPLPHAKPADANMRPGPVSLFVSRKEGKLFVRKGFEPLFDIPVTIARRDQPFGTHIFTASRPTDGSEGIRWLAVSLGFDRQPVTESGPAKGKVHAREERPATPSNEGLRKAAYDALDRIELPADVIERLSPLVATGASILIADQGLGDETGKETDFIVVTK